MEGRMDFYQHHDVLMSVVRKCKSVLRLARLLKRAGYSMADRKSILRGVRNK